MSGLSYHDIAWLWVVMSKGLGSRGFLQSFYSWMTFQIWEGFLKYFFILAIELVVNFLVKVRLVLVLSSVGVV